MRTIFQDFVRYLINEDEKTANAILFGAFYSDITIPRAIKVDSKEYLIKSILKSSHARIESLQFSPDSKLTKIEKEAFLYSTICRIFIPSSLIELEEGWCQYTQNLIKIDVDPNNPRYKCYDHKLIIGKSTIGLEYYDSLVFCVRNITEVTIPNTIKFIEPHSFEFCTKLQKIEFDSDSQLQIIGKQSFAFTAIRSLSIPPHVTRICENAFFQCKKLSTIEIPTNSELKTFEKYCFAFSIVESIFIPANLTELSEGWNKVLTHLKNIEIDPKNPRYSFYRNRYIIGKSKLDQDDYDTIVFSVSNLVKAKIPKFIKYFQSNAFNSSRHLRKVIFEPGSELEIIGQESLSNSLIETISIPQNVTKICSGAFSLCGRLQKIEIPKNSELRTIERNAFEFTSFEYLSIPASLIKLEEKWCQSTKKLINIQVDSKNPRYSCFENKFIIGKSKIEQANYDILIFSIRNIINVKIPQFIQIIGSSAFNYCEAIQSIDFPTNSKLKEICKNAFSYSSVKKMTIPSGVIKIGEYAFYYCKDLRHIDIPSNSKLQTICEQAFSDSSIKSISIPPQVSKIDKLAFYECFKLQIFEINENSKMEKIEKCLFINFPRESIIMIPKRIILI